MPLPWPPVSVVMPVRDEEQHLAEAVGRVLAQDYPGELEVVLAVGPSTDRTAEIAAGIAAGDPRVHVVANPEGVTPVALNRAIAAARFPVVVRVDGHGALADGYLRRAAEVLAETGADNVGGVMAAEGRTPLERAIARAYTSRLGLGGGRFHVGGQPGPVDSVFLGCFPRDVLLRHGGFDERYHRAQDWELNLRIRRAGGVVWFDPGLSVTYRPRSSLRALARQFFRTGQWRRDVLRQHPETASPRYLAPPVAVVLVAAGTAAGVAGLAGAPQLRWGWLLPAGYVAAVVGGAAVEGRGLDPPARAWLPVVLAVMHGSWGAGFLLSPRRIAGERPAPRW
jgi:cellulose synthase/poly-beta-1,6-N-acetylglucosamine synthase-like glycosyltransferase